MAELRVGDRVRWTSQARGVAKTKEGTIIFMDPGGVSLGAFPSPGMMRLLTEDFLEAGSISSDTAALLNSGRFVRKCDQLGAILVRVERPSKQHKGFLKPAIYSPRRSLLKKVCAAGSSDCHGVPELFVGERWCSDCGEHVPGGD